MRYLYEFLAKHPIVAGALLAALTYVFRSWIENLLRYTSRPFKWLGMKLYLWIAPRNPLSLSIRKYKAHLSRSNLAFLENPVGPSLRVPLEHSFAPLKLISSDQKREVDFFSYAARSNRFIVLGGPGTGKTTLMKSLLQAVIAKRCSTEPELNGYTPVFVVLRNLASRSHTVEESIIAAFADHHFPGANNFVHSALQQGKLLVILDGLDEVGPSRAFVVKQVQDFCRYDQQRTDKNKIIVTCREASYRTKDLRDDISEVVKVEPFGNDHMRIFLKGWPSHRGRYALSLFARIQNDSQIKDVCRNPLLLTILTGLFLDSDKFELPTSRDSFYQAALNELMIQRPSRRGIQQQLPSEKKSRLLEFIALRGLESANVNQDPEEFNGEVLRSAAKEIIDTDVSSDALLLELTEINGILKPAAEDLYTFPHRTIQEYLAAKECSRKRDTGQVIAESRRHSEMLEVLYFYCGIVKNIPQLNQIIEELMAGGHFMEAAKCLVNMTETPSAVLIARVTDALVRAVKQDEDSEMGLILLSSLSGRQTVGFERVKIALGDAIDSLMRPERTGSGFALESALATSPELAMKIVPALLASSAPERRRAALNLLRDIGTEQGLYQLVELLANEEQRIRAEAAEVIATIIKTRHTELAGCAILLPSCPPRPLIWPLDRYFSSGLALPLVTALAATNNPIPSRALQCGVLAVRELNQGGGDTCTRVTNSEIKKYWPRVARDWELNTACKRISRWCALTQLIPLWITVILLSIQEQSIVKRENIFIQSMLIVSVLVFGVYPFMFLKVTRRRIIVICVEDKYYYSIGSVVKYVSYIVILSNCFLCFRIWSAAYSWRKETAVLCGISIVLGLLAILLVQLNWPKNPFMDAVSELSSVSDDDMTAKIMQRLVRTVIGKAVVGGDNS